MEVILVLTAIAIAISIVALTYTVRIGKIATRALNMGIRASGKEDMNELRIQKLQELIPEDIKEERVRRNVLLKELNDEMERGLKMERDWNDGLSNILNYNGQVSAEGKNNE